MVLTGTRICFVSTWGRCPIGELILYTQHTEFQRRGSYTGAVYPVPPKLSPFEIEIDVAISAQGLKITRILRLDNFHHGTNPTIHPIRPDRQTVAFGWSKESRHERPLFRRSRDRCPERRSPRAHLLDYKQAPLLFLSSAQLFSCVSIQKNAALCVSHGKSNN